MGENRNILIIWDRLGEYHWARIAALKNVYEIGDIHVAEFGSGDSLYQWSQLPVSGIRHHLLSKKTVEEADLIGRINQYRTIIKQYDIKVVAQPGYAQPSYFIFLLLNRIFGLQTIFFAESWYRSNAVKDVLKKWLLRFSVNRFFVSGRRAYDYFSERLGQPVSKIAVGYSVIDNVHFRHDMKRVREKNKYLLCVARYSEEKNLRRLIEAFRLSASYGKWKLILVGDGPQREELQTLIGTDRSIELSGWKKYNELPVLYQKAWGMVLPSTFEPWGLVVNEAMAAGTPVAVSEYCGCVTDLEIAEEYIFDPYNAADMAKVIDRLYNLSDAHRSVLIDCQLRSISTFSCMDWANKMKVLVS
ncbi:MAG: glycosyltransferase family 4 protein [Cyclobacteriaceae bacterium]